MREIKFRAWDKLGKQMCTVICLNCHRNDEHIVKPLNKVGGCYNQSSGYLVVEQFTGLKDKNGKEIYEGDIVKDRTPETRWWDGIVTWHKEGSIGWVVEPLPKDRNKGAWGLNYGYTLEIIGTIHDKEEDNG